MNGNNPFHIVIAEHDNITNRRIIISSKVIDWRHAVYQESIEEEVVFSDMNLQRKNPVGKIVVM